MLSEEILALARQGNPRVLTAIINQTMRTYGVQARVMRREPCLHILLEAAQPPDQPSSVSFVQSLLQNLGVHGLETIRVYGHRIGERQIVWQQDVRLPQTAPPAPPPTPVVAPIPPEFVNPFQLPSDAPVVEEGSVTQQERTASAPARSVSPNPATPASATGSSTTSHHATPSGAGNGQDSDRRETVSRETVSRATHQDEVAKRVPVEVVTVVPQEETAKATEDMTRRPESVVLVFFLSLLAIWQIYLALVEETDTTPLTTGKLAQRLGVSRATLRRQRHQEDFALWTESRDPEGIAWCWRQGGGFVPAANLH